jgi:hypothetical protein
MRRQLHQHRPDQATVARHEAAHAVVALALGLGFGVVELAESYKDDGALRLGGLDYLKVAARTGQTDRDAAAVAFAGAIVDGHALGSTGDLAKIAALNRDWVADKSAGSPWAAAKRIVDGNLAAIDRVSAALLERGQLTLAEVIAVLS